MHPKRQAQYGFTLVEMIVVMVITGIIGGMVAIFIRAPVQGYVDSARRAEMTDVADIALRRLGRDIRTAVPNSIRVPAAACVAAAAAPCYVEFLPTKAGGRYRGEPATAGATYCGSFAEAVLEFNTIPADSCFEIIGAPTINFKAGATPDYIVIGSTQSDGNPPYDISANGILRAYTGAAGYQSTVNFTATALPVWSEVQGQRFDVVDGTQQAVTYACVGVGVSANGDGTGVLNRYANYGFFGAQKAPALIGVAPAVLATQVSACSITYNTVNQRNGLLELRLGITRVGESISLYHAIHVNNVP